VSEEGIANECSSAVSSQSFELVGVSDVWPCCDRYKWAFIISGGVTLVNAFFSWRYMIPPVKPATRGVYDPMREHRTAGEQKGLLAAGDMDDGE
jgi:hypothetical protein